MTVDELKKTGWIVYEILAGSTIYNLRNKNSDDDVRGIYNVPINEYIWDEFPTKVVYSPDDIVYMETITFIKLLTAGNPNIVDWLYTDVFIINDPIMDALFAVKEELITGDFIFKSLKMAESACKVAKTKGGEYKKLALAARIILTLGDYLNTKIYNPKMIGENREYILKIKNKEADYWKVVQNIEFGIIMLKSSFRIMENTIPKSFPIELKRKLITKFKLDEYKPTK